MMGHTKLLKGFYFILIYISLFLFALELIPGSNREKAGKNFKEAFDPSLSRLNSLANFIAYCDSLYGSAVISKGDSSRYANIVGLVVKQRFYHSYSEYGIGHNFVGAFLAPLIKSDLSSIVVPDDILKYPNAACSQQSIIGMEVLRLKGFNTRKVGFYKKGYGGHFTYEAAYDGKWHYYDPDKEPDNVLLTSLNRPSIEELSRDKEIMKAAYPNSQYFKIPGVIDSYFYGPVNTFPASRAIKYQYITRFLSYTLWLWLIFGYLLVKRKFIFVKPAAPHVEYPDISVSKRNLQPGS